MTFNVFSGTLNPAQSISYTFRVRHSRGQMYIGDGLLCVSLSVPCRIHTLLLRGPGCNLEEWLGVHYLADLQSVHGFRCYDNIHVCKLIALYSTL